MTRFPALALLAVFPAGVAMAQSGYGKSVTFSGLHWLAKVSSAKVGPGPNFFSQDHRELDIEFARWGSAANKNGWYTVQPYNVAGNQASFIQPSTTAGSTHILDWLRDPVSGNLSASFSSLFGFATAPSPNNQPIYQNTFNNGVPPTGGENVRMNLWLFQGKAPASRNSVEIVIDKFEFVHE